MTVSVYVSLAAQFDAICDWEQAFLFKVDQSHINLAPAIGDRGSPLVGCPCQPTAYPRDCTYLFSTTKYRGLDSYLSLTGDIINSLPEAFMYRRGKYWEGNDCTVYRISCSFCQPSDAASPTKFEMNHFQKMGTKIETLKQRSHSKKPATHRMPHSRMKTPKERNKYENYEEYEINVDPPSWVNKRTRGKRAKTDLLICGSVVYVRCYHSTGHWYLGKNSSLHHTNHAPIPPEFRSAARNDILPIEIDFMHLLLDHGISNSSTADVLTSLRKRQGMLGVIRTKTLDNLAAKNHGNLDFLLGVSRKWSVAERTIRHLQRIRASWCALVMDKNDNLIVYKGKGRHSKIDSESLRINGNLKKELRLVRKQLELDNGEKILLALSVATDEMIRAMQMHPEVQFMDQMSNVNSQKRDIFLSVLKASTGGCFIGNLTILPCQQRWIFLKIYQTFFLFLYGVDTISRLRLVLTDDDEASHSAFDTCTIIVPSYNLCIHMLCIFHGLVMKLHKEVWPKLPHRSDNRQLLTPLGRRYCESSIEKDTLVGVLDLLSQILSLVDTCRRYDISLADAANFRLSYSGRM